MISLAEARNHGALSVSNDGARVAGWFASDFAGREMPEPWASADLDADRDWEFHSAADDTAADLIALYDAACDRSRALVDGAASLADLSVKTGKNGQHWSLRWILVHMIEEYARHVGHADLIRESIDGATGD